MDTSVTIYPKIKKVFGTLLKQKQVYTHSRRFLHILMVLTLIFNCLKANSQKKTRICYNIPSIVQKKIAVYIDKSKSNENFYVILQHQNDTTSILLSSYNKSFNKLLYLLANTNRYIKISGTKDLPLLLNSDLLFSEILHSIKNSGRENEIISNTEVNPGGYSIIYKGVYQDIKIIKEEYLQY